MFRKTTLPLVLFLLLGALIVGAAGCGGGSNDIFSNPGPTSFSVSALTPNGLTATLSQDRATIRTTDTVTYTLTLTNTTASPVVVRTSGFDATNAPPPAFIRIVNAQGAFVYPDPTWPVLGVPADPELFVTLQPGASLTAVQPFPAFFDQPGRYRATATFTVGENEINAGPLTLTVVQ